MTIKGIKNSLTMFEMKIFLFFIMSCCACIGYSNISLASPIPPEISDGIRIIGEQKSKCEQATKNVKRNYAKNTEQYQAANNLYIDAKAAFDGWIDQLKFDLTAHIDINKSERYKESLLEASGKSEAFLKYADSIIFKAPTKSIGVITVITVAMSILPPLTDAAIKIWKQYTISAKERREEIKEELDKLKWKNFAEI